MKEQIYTIPVNDAFNQNKICPVCELELKRTEQLIEYYLGPSLMEPDNRVETNKKGFCNEHFAKLYNSQENRLGFALMTHTLMLEQRKKLEKILTLASSSARKDFFNFRGNSESNLEKAAGEIRETVMSCALCDRLKKTMENYFDVIFYQYKEDSKFRPKFKDIVGFCLPHLADLLEKSQKYLRAKDIPDFVTLLKLVEINRYEALAAELEWFTMKFDYKNKEKPWNNSRTAIPRSINFISGHANLDRDDSDD